MPPQPKPGDLKQNLNNMINTSPVGAPGQALLGLEQWLKQVMPRGVGRGLDNVGDTAIDALRELLLRRKQATWIDDGIRTAKDYAVTGGRAALDATDDLTTTLWRLFNR